MNGKVGVAPGTLTVTLDGNGNQQLSLVDPFSMHVTSKWPFEAQPVRPEFVITADGRVIPSAAPFMQKSSWNQGEPFRSIAMAQGYPGPLANKAMNAGLAGAGALGLGAALVSDVPLAMRSGWKLAFAVGLGGIAGGIGGAAVGAGKGHRGDAAGCAALGSLVGPIGTVAGAAICAGKGRRIRSAVGSVVGALAGGLVAGVVTYLAMGGSDAFTSQA